MERHVFLAVLFVIAEVQEVAGVQTVALGGATNLVSAANTANLAQAVNVAGLQQAIVDEVPAVVPGDQYTGYAGYYGVAKNNYASVAIDLESYEDAETYNQLNYHPTATDYMISTQHLDEPTASHISYAANIILGVANALNDKRVSDHYRPLNSLLQSICPAGDRHDPGCTNTRPNLNGTCNNREHPSWGATFQCTRHDTPQQWEHVAVYDTQVVGVQRCLFPHGLDLRGQTSFVFHLRGLVKSKIYLKFYEKDDCSGSPVITIIFKITNKKYKNTEISIKTQAAKGEAKKHLTVADGAFRVLWVSWSKDHFEVGDGCEIGATSLLSVDSKATGDLYAAVSLKGTKDASFRFPIVDKLNLITTPSLEHNLEEYQYDLEGRHSIFFVLSGEEGTATFTLRDTRLETAIKFQINGSQSAVSYVNALGYERVLWYDFNKLDLSKPTPLWLSYSYNVITLGLGESILPNTKILLHLRAYAERTDSCHIDTLTIGSIGGSHAWQFSLVQKNKPIETSICGCPLPNARQVSLAIHARKDGDPTVWSKKLSMVALFWGQFLDHDIFGAPEETYNGNSISCCNGSREFEDPDRVHPFCNPIVVNYDLGTDPGFTEGHCMPFRRTGACVDCEDDADQRCRRQLNEVTSFIDMSQVYSNGVHELEELIDHTNPYLMALVHNELPFRHMDQACSSEDDNECRLSGDGRNNENPALNSMHTLFVRLHNIIARKLIALDHDSFKSNANYEHELFYRVRNIVIAIGQQITYNEFLPSFMDETVLRDKEILNDNVCNYDPTLDPTGRANAVMGYRVGHSWIINKIQSENLHDLFFNPDFSYLPGGTDKVLVELLDRACTHTDRTFEDSVGRHLFEKGGIALDLAAFNIQREIDHGISDYCVLRDFYGLFRPQTFDDLITEDIMEKSTVNDFKTVYKHVCDIGLFSGSTSEIPKLGALGELLHEILLDQFRRFRCGDRFDFMHDDMGFTAAQKTALMEVTVSKVICAAAPGVTKAQPWGMLNKKFTSDDIKDNSQVPCKELLQEHDGELLDYNLFKLSLPIVINPGGPVLSSATNVRPVSNVRPVASNTGTVRVSKKEHRDELLEELESLLDKMDGE